VCLVNVVHERIPPGGALIEVFGLFKGFHYKMEHQWEGGLDLHGRVVLNVHSQILCINLLYRNNQKQKGVILEFSKWLGIIVETFRMCVTLRWLRIYGSAAWN
jgi:hypothetical protein